MADTRNDGGPDQDANPPVPDPFRLSDDEAPGSAPVPGRGGESIPSGWRHRVEPTGDPVRDKQEQAIEQHQRRYGAHFTRTQFVAYMNGSDMKFNRNGDVVVNLIVPYEHRDLAMPLSDAFGIPLSVDIEVWRPYSEATETS